MRITDQRIVLPFAFVALLQMTSVNADGPGAYPDIDAMASWVSEQASLQSRSADAKDAAAW